MSELCPPLGTSPPAERRPLRHRRPLRRTRPSKLGSAHPCRLATPPPRRDLPGVPPALNGRARNALDRSLTPCPAAGPTGRLATRHFARPTRRSRRPVPARVSQLPPALADRDLPASCACRQCPEPSVSCSSGASVAPRRTRMATALSSRHRRTSRPARQTNLAPASPLAS